MKISQKASKDITFRMPAYIAYSSLSRREPAHIDKELLEVNSKDINTEILKTKIQKLSLQKRRNVFSVEYGDLRIIVKLYQKKIDVLDILNIKLLNFWSNKPN